MKQDKNYQQMTQMNVDYLKEDISLFGNAPSGA